MHEKVLKPKKLGPDNGGHYHIRTSPKICSANQSTGFYMIGICFLKEFNQKLIYEKHLFREFRALRITLSLR